MLRRSAVTVFLLQSFCSILLLVFFYSFFSSVNHRHTFSLLLAYTLVGGGVVVSSSYFFLLSQCHCVSFIFCYKLCVTDTEIYWGWFHYNTHKYIEYDSQPASKLLKLLTMCTNAIRYTVVRICYIYFVISLFIHR